MKNHLLLFVGITIFLISIGANIAFVSKYTSLSKEVSKVVEDARTITIDNKNYKYVSSRVFYENTDVLINFVPLRQMLREYAGLQDSRIGIYFEYLPSGTSIGVNDREAFFQASLVKVPMAMVTYKHIERGDLTLQDQLEIKEDDIDARFGDLWEKGVGHKLTVQEALDYALLESDNTAYHVLLSTYPSFLDEVFDFLDLPKDSEDNEPVVTPKNYSSIFRSLYLSSYLKPEYSEELLTMLTQTDFTDRIQAGVSKDIPVAHKIGVLKNRQTYSDCGIVYYPKRPYILCVMVEDEKDETAYEIMEDVSQIVFKYVDMAKAF